MSVFGRNDQPPAVLTAEETQRRRVRTRSHAVLTHQLAVEREARASAGRGDLAAVAILVGLGIGLSRRRGGSKGGR